LKLLKGIPRDLKQKHCGIDDGLIKGRHADMVIFDDVNDQGKVTAETLNEWIKPIFEKRKYATP